LEKIKELFSKHPYLIGGGAVAVFIVFYYLFSRGSSNGGATTYTMQSASSGDAASNNALAVAQLQSQTALAAKQIDASTATEQINAAHDVALTQYSAQLEGLKSNNDTQVALAQVQAGQNEATSKALEDIVTAQYTSQDKAREAAYGYLSTLSTNQTATQISAINARSTIDKSVLAQLDKVHNSALVAGILNSVATGDSSAAVTSQQAVSAGTISTNNLIGNTISSVLGALF